MYEIIAIIADCPEAGEHLEGRRSGMRSAFALARKRYREYKGHARIIVRLVGGLVIADDPSDFYLHHARYHTTHRGLPK